MYRSSKTQNRLDLMILIWLSFFLFICN